jgi:putative hydrolase
MQLIADLHSHTIASTHAFSTLNEMVSTAQSLGLKALAITDHGVAMPDAPHSWYFNTLRRLPSIVNNGFLLLKGVEANVMGPDGSVDMKEEVLKTLDWVIVSAHTNCVPQLSYEEATKMWLAVAQNPYVDMIGHCEEEKFRFNYDLVTREFAKQGKVVEINAASSTARPGNENNQREILECCKRNSVFVALTSDAHSQYMLGSAAEVLPLLEEVGFPEAFVVNSNVQRLSDILKLHGRLVWKIAQELV